MMHDLEIRLEGVSGFSAVLAFEDDDIHLSLGGNTRSGDEYGEVAILRLPRFHADITGGPEFRAEVEKCRVDGKFQGSKLFRLGAKYVFKKFEEDPMVFFSMLYAVRKDAMEKGEDVARAEIRKALGIVDRGGSVFHEFGEDDEGLA